MPADVTIPAAYVPDPTDPRFLGFDDFADRVVDTGILTDPWFEGVPRMQEQPLVLTPKLRDQLYRAAEGVAGAYNELALMCHDHPELAKDFLQLTPLQLAMWESAAPMWHTIARADVFMTDDGPQLTEINSDTPTGAAEAVVLNEVVRAAHPELHDPNTELLARFSAATTQVVEATEAIGKEPLPRIAGLVFPTEHTEDHGLIRLYKRWLEADGWSVVYGSPFNLTVDSDLTPYLFDQPIGLMVRHYKTDWWGERPSVWDDGEYPDPEPLGEQMLAAFEANHAGKLAIVNPFGAVVPQNKRAMALMWEHLGRFSLQAQEAIRAHVPVSNRLETLHIEQLVAEKDDWVIKSDYGAEGDEVVIGRLASEADWRASIGHAVPGHWIAQRYFHAQTDNAGENVNYGVFLVAGRASGLYARVQRGATDDHALSTPVFISK